VATNYSPKISTDGLALCLDPANPKCFTPGETTCRNLVTEGVVTGASGTPGSGSHSPNSSNFPSFSSQNVGVFDFAGGKGMNCEEDLGGSTGELTLILCFYRSNSSGTDYFTDARNDGGQWFLSNYSGENINYTNDLRYNFDASYNPASSDFINHWFHMAVTSDGNGSLLYLNGYEISSHPKYRNSYVSTTSLDEALGRNFRIGTRYTTSGQWVGLMGPIYAYKRKMSAEEIYQNFSGLRNRYGI
jgi:hypothetical protein